MEPLDGTILYQIPSLAMLRDKRIAAKRKRLGLPTPVKGKSKAGKKKDEAEDETKPKKKRKRKDASEPLEQPIPVHEPQESEETNFTTFERKEPKEVIESSNLMFTGKNKRKRTEKQI